MAKIYTVDLLFQETPHLISSYILEGTDSVALIEPGPASTVGRVVGALAELGYRPGDVKDVMVSHIHLDHAGAAGWWAERGARIHAHHAGANHLINPARLIDSATRIYKDRMAALWGDILPVPESRMRPLYDGDHIASAGTELIAIDSPGHAKHHIIYKCGAAAFTGDACGVRLSGGHPHVSLPAPPPEFNPVAWQKLLDRLRTENLETIYLTHYGKISDVEAHLNAVAMIIDKACAYIQGLIAQGRNLDEITGQYFDWVRNQGQKAGLNEQEIMAHETINPSEMSVVGIMRYLQN